MNNYVNMETLDIPFLKTLGVSLREVAEQHAEMVVTIDDRHLNYMGTAHGGMNDYKYGNNRLQKLFKKTLDKQS